MFQLIRETQFRFMAWRKAAFIFSLSLVLIGIVFLIARGGPRYSIDFAGGRLIELAFANREVEAGDVRKTLSDIGLGDAEVQYFKAGGATGEHSGVILRFKADTQVTGAGEGVSPTPAIVSALEKGHPGLSVDIRREESVGPKIGSELRGRAVKAIMYALGAILIYVGVRYEFRFALGAVIALFHDVFITFGAFSVLNLEISLPIVAALLTIAGYSINDTIVVFDRIRERRRQEQRKSLEFVVDSSINQVLSRTIVTSVTTLFAAGSLFVFGGPVIHDFALAMVIGVVIGTYSSIFVATALAFALLTRHEHGSGRKKSPSPVAVAKS